MYGCGAKEEPAQGYKYAKQRAFPVSICPVVMSLTVWHDCEGGVIGNGSYGAGVSGMTDEYRVSNGEGVGLPQSQQ